MSEDIEVNAPEEFPTEKEKKSAKKSKMREFLTSFGIIFAVFILFFFIIGIVPVEGSSMQPLLNPAENESDKCYVVILRPAEIGNGDVVIMEKPDSPEINLIKRVIAMPGQTVKVYRDPEDRENAVIEVDGTVLNEDYIPEKMAWTQWEYTGTGNNRTHLFSNYRKPVDENEWIIEFTVPEDSFFALGDNRNYSRDSRHYGFFKFDTVLGRAFVIIDKKGVRFI